MVRGRYHHAAMSPHHGDASLRSTLSACLVVCLLAACNQPPPRRAHPPAASANASATAEPVVASAAECPLTDKAEGVERCEDGIRFDDAECSVERAPCLRLDVPQGKSLPFQACLGECMSIGGHIQWATRCGACKHTCPLPTPSVPTYEVDTSDCASRTVKPCDAEAVTLTEQLDGMLRTLVTRVAKDDPGLIELKEDTLVTHFEDGCAVQFYGHFNGGLPLLAPALRKALEAERWACAMQPSCGNVEGPSTLQ